MASNKKYLTSVWVRNLLKYEKKYLDDFIPNKTGVLGTFMDPTDVLKIYDRYKKKSSDYQISDARDIWNVITLKKWLELNKINDLS